MSYVFLALFAAASLVHLYHSWLNDRKKRAVTKPMLLLFLTLYYCTSAASVNVFLLLALVTSWLGDVLLIPTYLHTVRMLERQTTATAGVRALG